MANLTRLKHLRDCLVQVQEQDELAFNMRFWAQTGADPDDIPEKPITRRDAKKIDCGFAACALGHAAMYPPLRKAGLQLVFDGLDFGAVRYNDHDDEYAGAEFFEITMVEAGYLFYPDEYGFDEDIESIKPHHVIEKVDKLIADYESDND